MAGRTKREDSTTAEAEVEQTAPAESNGDKEPRKVAPSLVMAEVDDFPEANRGASGPNERWTKALTKIKDESPHKVIMVAKFRGDTGATNVKTRIVGGNTVKGEVQPTQLPEGTTPADWELVARRLPAGDGSEGDITEGGEFKSALYARFGGKG